VQGKYLKLLILAAGKMLVTAIRELLEAIHFGEKEAGHWF
jgi:hypothetical protein